MLGVSLLASYVAGVMINAVRISIAMWLAAHPVTLSTLTAADIHRLEGIVVYFGGLLLLYEIVRRVDRGSPVFRYALPLGCYYLVTVGLPLANGAAQAGEAFLAHALIVLLVPPVVILFVWGIQVLFSRYPQRSVSTGSSAQARRAGSHAAAAATSAIAPAPNR